jgi:hypothetical protein
MIIVPGPVQIAGICLSLALPFLAIIYAKIVVVRGTGRRFRATWATAAGLFVAACVLLPGDRQFDDVLAGLLLLATAMLLSHLVWGLLAWGFTLTLLTALVHSGRPLTSEQWAAAYMQGGDIGTFAHNRLRLLTGSRLVRTTNGTVAPTARGLAVAFLVKLVRLSTGLG